MPSISIAWDNDEPKLQSIEINRQDGSKTEIINVNDISEEAHQEILTKAIELGIAIRNADQN